MYPKNRTQITGLTAAQWNVKALSDFVTVEDGSTSAIIIFENPLSSGVELGVRAVGDTDTAPSSNTRYFGARLVPLNGSNQVEVYGNGNYYILGVGPEVNFLETPITKSLAQTGAWQPVDLSGDGLPSGAAYLVCKSATDIAIRAVSETFEDSVTDANNYNRAADDFFVVLIDGSDTFEVNNDNVASGEIVVYGWIAAPDFKWIANPTLRTPAVLETWETYPDSDSDVVIAQVENKQTGSSSAFISVRKPGTSGENRISAKHCPFWVETTSGQFEFYDGKTTGPDNYFAFRGGFKLSSGEGTPGNASGDIATATASAPEATAIATVSVTLTLVDDNDTPLASTTRRFWTRAALHTAAVDGGTDGLEVTSNGSGQFVISGLSITPGEGWLTWVHPSDPLNSHNVPVTYA